jgi:hypothetical protein
LRGRSLTTDEAIQITKIKYLYDKTYQNIGKDGIVYRLGLFLIIFWIAALRSQWQKKLPFSYDKQSICTLFCHCEEHSNEAIQMRKALKRILQLKNMK